jgi:transcriptional regulator GlxA family with amidase domain
VLARKLLGDPARGRARSATSRIPRAFSDLSYFNRAFRKRFGATPSELREA